MNVVNLFLLVIYSFVYSIKNYNSIFNIVFSLFIILFLYGKIILKNNISYSKKNILLSLILSIVISLFTVSSISFNNKLTTISIENVGSNYITIDGIYLDNKKVKTNHNYIRKYDNIYNENLITEYKLYNKIDKSYKMTLEPGEEYNLNIKKKKNVEIMFQKGKDESIVLIDNEKINIDSYNYGKNKKANKIYDSSYKYTFNNIENNNILVYILTLLISIYLYFNLIIRCIDDKKNIMCLLLPILLEFNNIINISFFGKFIIVLILYFINLKANDYSISKKYKVLLLFSSLYISFSFLGDRIINSSFSIYLLILYLLIVLLIYLLIPYIFSIIEKIKNNNVDNKKRIIRHRIFIFLITLLICFLYHYIFYPYVVHTDTYMELLDITNNTYSNWHPYFHILLMRGFYTVFNDVIYFLYFRFIIYSLLLNIILFYFYNKGLSLKKIYIISILFTIFPVTGMMLITLVKDIDFSLALLALSFYIYLVIKDLDYFKNNRMNYVFLSISLFLVGVLRHNGIYIFIGTLLLLLYIVFKYKRFSLLVSIVLSSLLVFIIRVPLYNHLKVEDSPRNFDIAPLIHGFSYLIVEDEDIDKEILSYLDKNVLEKDELISKYDKYNNDLLLHYSGSDIRNKKISKSKIIKMYIKQFFITPIPLIKDRLYGSDMLWSVPEKDYIKNYKYQTIYDEFDINYSKLIGVKSKYNKLLSSIVNKILIFIANNELLNILFFRVGIYIDILIILFMYLFINKRKELLSSVPIIINIITLFISMAHQEYRYVWMIELVVLILVLVTIYDKENLN